VSIGAPAESSKAGLLDSPVMRNVNKTGGNPLATVPPADKFKAFPPEAQKAFLAAFGREQIEGHDWFKNQQGYDHQLNLWNSRYLFISRMAGTIVGGCVVISVFAGGAWLVKNGASPIGAATMIAALGSLIGPIYGHRTSVEKKDEET